MKGKLEYDRKVGAMELRPGDRRVLVKLTLATLGTGANRSAVIGPGNLL